MHDYGSPRSCLWAIAINNLHQFFHRNALFRAGAPALPSYRLHSGSPSNYRPVKAAFLR
jgi:hypothetical protein